MTAKRIWLFVGLVILGIVVYAIWATSRAGYETAPYKVVEKAGPFEIRDYEAVRLVTTPMGEGQSNGSFGRLFRYISGDNESGSKIAMTTPVFMPATSEGDMREMQFVVPVEVAEAGAPAPTGNRVELKDREAARYAALRFSGRSGAGREKEKLAELRAWMEEQDEEPAGDPVFAGYDPPWTPPPLRRNEVLVPLRRGFA